MAKKTLFASIIAILLLSPGCAHNYFSQSSNGSSCKECPKVVSPCACEQNHAHESFTVQDTMGNKLSGSMMIPKKDERSKSLGTVTIQSMPIPKTAVKQENGLRPQFIPDQDKLSEYAMPSGVVKKEINIMQDVTPPLRLQRDKMLDSRFELAVQKKKLHYLLNQFKNSPEFNERNVHELVVLLYLELEIIEHTLNKYKKKLEGSLAVKSHLLHNTPPMVKRIFDFSLKVAQLEAASKKARKQEYLQAMSNALLDTYSSMRVIEDSLADENQHQKTVPQYRNESQVPVHEFFPLYAQAGKVGDRRMLSQSVMPYQGATSPYGVPYSGSYAMSAYQPMPMMPVMYNQPAQYAHQPLVYQPYQTPYTPISNQLVNHQLSYAMPSTIR